VGILHPRELVAAVDKIDSIPRDQCRRYFEERALDRIFESPVARPVQVEARVLFPQAHVLFITIFSGPFAHRLIYLSRFLINVGRVDKIPTVLLVL